MMNQQELRVAPCKLNSSIYTLPSSRTQTEAVLRYSDYLGSHHLYHQTSKIEKYQYPVPIPTPHSHNVFEANTHYE